MCLRGVVVVVCVCVGGGGGGVVLFIFYIPLKVMSYADVKSVSSHIQTAEMLRL